jgi:hypothetical protein
MNHIILLMATSTFHKLANSESVLNTLAKSLFSSIFIIFQFLMNSTVFQFILGVNIHNDVFLELTILTAHLDLGANA